MSIKCSLLSPVCIVIPRLGWRPGCGCVVDFRFHTLAALFDSDSCVATLARHMSNREVKLRGQPPPVDVFGEVNAFAPTVVF